MKKTLLTFTLTLFLFLAACTDDGGEDVSYDERSLVTEECEHLENIDTWQPVWCDEFDTDGLPNPENWGYDTGGDGWGNNELQFYTQEDLDNAFIEDGILNIKAIKETHQDNDYTSARLVSKFRGDWEYARIQVRAKMPSGATLPSTPWPSFSIRPNSAS